MVTTNNSPNVEYRPLHRMGDIMYLPCGLRGKMVDAAWEMVCIEVKEPREVVSFDRHSGSFNATGTMASRFWVPLPGHYPVHDDNDQIIGIA